MVLNVKLRHPPSKKADLPSYQQRYSRFKPRNKDVSGPPVAVTTLRVGVLFPYDFPQKKTHFFLYQGGRALGRGEKGCAKRKGCNFKGAQCQKLEGLS